MEIAIIAYLYAAGAFLTALAVRLVQLAGSEPSGPVKLGRMTFACLTWPVFIPIFVGWGLSR